MAVLLASTSDLDDAIPTLVAYQLEWNKLHTLMISAELPEEPSRWTSPRSSAGRRRTGSACRSWPDGSPASSRRPHPQAQLAAADARRLAVGLRAADAALVGADPHDADRPGALGPPDVLRLLQPHSLVNLLTTKAGASEDEIVDFVESQGPDYLIEELERFRTGRTKARGRTSSITPRGCTTRARPTTDRPGSGGARTSASSASRTSLRAPACASARR